MTPSRKTRRILIVEDEPMIAIMIEDLLDQLFDAEMTTFATLEHGAEAAEKGHFDFAALDINLGEQDSLPIADILMRRRVPFFFITGYSDRDIPPRYARVPVVTKPFATEDIRQILEKQLKIETCAPASTDHPPGI